MGRGNNSPLSYLFDNWFSFMFIVNVYTSTKAPLLKSVIIYFRVYGLYINNELFFTIIIYKT